MKMLVILLAASIIAVAAARTSRDLIQLSFAIKKCRLKNPIEPTTLDRAIGRKIINDPQFDCFLGCLLQAMNIMDKSGTLDIDAAISKVSNNAHFGAGLVEPIIACADQRGSDICDTAHRLYECVRQSGV